MCADHGMEGDGPYRAARDLLMRSPPRIGGQPIQTEGRDHARLRPCGRAGDRRGSTSHSGAAGRRQDLHRRADDLRPRRGGKDGRGHGEQSQGHSQPARRGPGGRRGDEASTCAAFKSSEARRRKPISRACASRQTTTNCSTRSATTATWPAELHGSGRRQMRPTRSTSSSSTRPAQMSLANVLAVSQAARSVVLLGDPQQLEQPCRAAIPKARTSRRCITCLTASKRSLPTAACFSPRPGGCIPTSAPSLPSFSTKDGCIRGRAGVQQIRSGVRFSGQRPSLRAGADTKAIKAARRKKRMCVRDIVDELMPTTRPGLTGTMSSARSRCPTF